MKFIREVLSFEDVTIIPQFSNIKHRSEVSLEASLSDKLKFKIPFIVSPMDCISGHKMMKAMANLGGLAILHRSMTVDEQCEEIEKFKKVLPDYPVAVAIGMVGDCVDIASTLITRYNVEILCIDVAHGDHELMKVALNNLKLKFPDVYIIAGNVATPGAFKRLSNWGVDAVRVGISGGSACRTRDATGHGLPTFQSILDCYEIKKNHNLSTKILADGGIKNSADICKSLGIGADFVMVGSFVAATEECPFPIVFNMKGVPCKVFRGQASYNGQLNMKGKVYSVEGVETLIKYKGSVKPIIEQALENIKSGLSYSNAKTIQEFQEVAVFAKQTTNGFIEGTPHILNNR